MVAIGTMPGIASQQNCARPRIRECTFNDHEQIADLTERSGLEAERFEHWRDLWLTNSAYRKAGSGWPIGWVLEDPRKKLVGYLGNIPLRYLFRGRELVAATSRTWVVEKTYRAYAPLLLDLHFSQRDVDLFVHPTVNADAYAAYRTFAVRPVPVGAWDRAIFWITRYVGSMQALLRSKRVPCAAALSYPGAAVLYLKDKVAGRRLAAHSDIEFEECESFDERFDTFWNELKSQSKDLLLAVRSREALQWHFHYALAQQRASVIVIGQRPRIAGYAIFFRNDNRELGLTRLRLVDFQVLTDRERTLRAALAWGVEKCRQEGIHVLEVIGFRPYGSTLIEELAPYSRRLPRWLYFYKAKEAALARELADPAVWNPCGFDGDASL